MVFDEDANMPNVSKNVHRIDVLNVEEKIDGDSHVDEAQVVDEKLNLMQLNIKVHQKAADKLDHYEIRDLGEEDEKDVKSYSQWKTRKVRSMKKKFHLSSKVIS